MASILFEDIVEVTDLNPGGKKFDRVDRIVGETEGFHMKVILDINCHLFKAHPGEKLRLLLTTSLLEDDTHDNGEYNPNLANQNTLADHFEYVMYGRSYKLKDIDYADSSYQSGQAIAKTSIFISFGGLLMNITGDINKLKRIGMDQQLYLLLKKISY